jgi:hypothetical protein
VVKVKPNASLHAVRRQLAVVRKREAAPYDGVLGSLPDWMPEHLRDRFEYSRNELLDKHAADDVRRWLKAFRSCHTQVVGFHSAPTYPPNLKGPLRDLDEVEYLVSAGKTQASELLIGTHGAQSIGAAAIRTSRRNSAAKAGSAPRNVERDKRILTANKRGKAPKQIADDEDVSVSTVRRVLNRAVAK